MNEMINTLENLKDELNKELLSTAQSVCRIGYLLKLARDTDILREEYKDVYEFASAEYGLDKSQVSRFININDRFSVDGNSEQLLPEYSQYGSSKLSIMLTLPDEINEELSPEMSKADIQTIKSEYEEEQNITPIERMTEDTSEVPDDFITAIIKQLNDEHPEPAELMKESIDIAKSINLPENWNFENDAKEAYMPDGDKTYIVIIPGRGRHMIKCTDDQLMITCMYDMQKTPLSWEEFADTVVRDVEQRKFEEEKPKEKTKSKKVEKPKKPEKTPSGPEKEEPKEAAGETKENTAAGTEEAANEAEEAKEASNEAAGETEEHKEAAGEEIRKLERIANDIRALGDQFHRGTGGNLYDNPLEELEGMIDEINAMPGQLIPIIEDAIRRIKPKEEA